MLQVGCVRPGLVVTGLECGKTMKVRVLHQQSPENEQEGIKRPVKALLEGTRSHCSLRADIAVCLKEGGKKKNPNCGN